MPLNDLLKSLKKELNERELTLVRPLLGGCLSESYHLKSSKKDYFLKLNSKEHLEMFEKEAEGLKALKNTQLIRVPEVYLTLLSNDRGCLLLEYINLKTIGRRCQSRLGENLANMHLKRDLDQFGFYHNNFIGSSSQINNFKDNWITFFIENRFNTSFI